MSDQPQQAMLVPILTHGCECGRDMCATHKGISEALTQAHAAGRREGLAEAAAVAEGRAQRARPDSELRADYFSGRDEAERIAAMIRAKTNER